MDQGPIQTSKHKITGKYQEPPPRPGVASQQSAYQQLAQCQCEGHGVCVRSAPPIRSRNKVRRLDSDVQQSPAFGRAFFLPPHPNASRSTRENDATATPAATPSRFSARRFGDAIRALSIHLLILARLVANDGIFLDKRRMPQRTRSRELNAAIQRTWRRGGRPPSGQSADRPHQIWCTGTGKRQRGNAGLPKGCQTRPTTPDLGLAPSQPPGLLVCVVDGTTRFRSNVRPGSGDGAHHRLT